MARHALVMVQRLKTLVGFDASWPNIFMHVSASPSRIGLGFFTEDGCMFVDLPLGIFFLMMLNKINYLLWIVTLIMIWQKWLLFGCIKQIQLF
jgi:hypothetical protein